LNYNDKKSIKYYKSKKRKNQLIMTTFPWLTTIVLFPVSAGLVIPLLPNRGNHIIRWYALGICLLDLILMTYVFGSDYHIYDFSLQLKEDYSWIESIDFHWRLGVDGLSIGLFLLTGFMTSLATLAAWPVTRNPKLFYFLMLAMYSGQLGLFASQDLLLFFFMWELELIPVYLLLSLWGGKRRLYAATKFILYTAGGSIFLLAGILTASLWSSNIPMLDMQSLSNKTYPLSIEILIYLGFLIAYAVKLPALPLHTWLPDTHGEAHYSTCMLLAGILLKMGGYGFIRINMELLPHAHMLFAPWLICLGAIQIVYAALVSFGQKNLKRRIAYSSVSHMGFVLIGAGALSNLALSGAMLQMISHGLIGAALFFLAGTSYDRTRTLVLTEMGGWATSMPKMFAMLTICAMASLALPGMSGFVSELMIFFGVITSTCYSPVFRAIITLIEGLGIILTPIYLLSMLRQMFYGSSTISKSISYQDASPREVFVIVSLLFPIFGIGFYPNFVLPLWSLKTEAVAKQVQTELVYHDIYYHS
jgi:NAD(P)H-quinone oxidoreductase subunit 4